MAVHAYTGVTGNITVSGTLVGWISGDFTLSTSTGKYVELGSTKGNPTAHTRGLRAASGSIKGAWGIKDATFYSWYDDDTELVIKFDATQAGTTASYTISGCVITELSIEGPEAGGEGALVMNASWEGLNWGRNV
tara:strand:- start:354 stop:758 length:405 start_codon:yes stop_codon:yes gene_type:complete